MTKKSAEIQLSDITKRLDAIEKILGISLAHNGGDTITKIKAIIKKGSNDFNNNVKDNPFPVDTKEFEWWMFGFNYARELDEQ